MDKLSRERRSANMARIRNKDTGPEIALRKLIYGLGYRFRLHCKDLPGKPDLVFRSRRKIIFLHGCFWHQHKECPEGRIPGSNRDYWEYKLRRNLERDAENEAALEIAGWKVLTVWECNLRDLKSIRKTLLRFLGKP
jgi:DNA mismatch endonuclease, patch repair protein